MLTRSNYSSSSDCDLRDVVVSHCYLGMDLSPDHLHRNVELKAVREKDCESHQDFSTLGESEIMK